jgi:2-oxoglutarate dehydrogenase E2 component (dihydrolipoamide succinyltransferase)
MMFVSMSYDHRIIDGGMGSLFLAAFVEALESFDVNRTF